MALHSRHWLFLLVWVVCIFGCGPAKPAQVDGTVTLDGAPLPGVRISFIPVDPDKIGNIALTKKTDADGRFDVEGGLRPGEYKIVVVLERADAADVKPFPAQYSKPDATPLRLTVPYKKPLVLELTSMP